MPPERLYVVTSIGPAEAKLVVSPDQATSRLGSRVPNFLPTCLERESCGTPRDASFGTDRWGYLQSGERWRYVKFSTGDAWDMNLCLRASRPAGPNCQFSVFSRGTKISKSESRGGSCCQLLVSRLTVKFGIGPPRRRPVLPRGNATCYLTAKSFSNNSFGQLAPRLITTRTWLSVAGSEM